MRPSLSARLQREDFTVEAIAKVSKACTSICMWARAMHMYHNVSLSVAPKRAALAAAQAELDATMATLHAAQVSWLAGGLAGGRLRLPRLGKAEVQRMTSWHGRHGLHVCILTVAPPHVKL